MVIVLYHNDTLEIWSWERGPTINDALVKSMFSRAWLSSKSRMSTWVDSQKTVSRRCGRLTFVGCPILLNGLNHHPSTYSIHGMPWRDVNDPMEWDSRHYKSLLSDGFVMQFKYTDKAIECWMTASQLHRSCDTLMWWLPNPVENLKPPCYTQWERTSWDSLGSSSGIFLYFKCTYWAMAQCDFELLEGSIATSTPHSPVEPFKSLPTVSDEKIRERILFRRTAWCRCLRMTWIAFQELPALGPTTYAYMLGWTSVCCR